MSENIKIRYENRPSREEDLFRIRRLENDAVERENILASVREEVASLKRELLNREKDNSYNKKFIRGGADTDGPPNTDSHPTSSGGGGGGGGSGIGYVNAQGHGDGAEAPPVGEGVEGGREENEASRQLSALRKSLDDRVRRWFDGVLVG